MTDAPLSILHLLSHDRVTSGGAFQALFLARAQKARGHDVRVVHNASGDPAADREAFAPFIASGVPSSGVAMQGIARFLGRRQFRREVVEFAPHVIHAHRERALRFALAALGSGAPGGAIVVAQRGNCYRSDPATAEAFRDARVVRIVAVARAVKDLLVEHDGVAGDKIEVVYGSFDKARFLAPSLTGARAAVRAELGIAAEVPVVGILANLDRKKGHNRFFAAAAQVHAARPDALFLVVGGGDVDEGKRLAEKNGVLAATRFTGFRSDPERMLAAFDVSVNCSKDGEGLTGALRESLAVGCAVACTDVGGNRELIEDGVTGRLVPTGDPSALAGAILDLIGDRDAARRMAEAGRRRVLDWMDDDRRCERVLAIYRDALAAR